MTSNVAKYLHYPQTLLTFYGLWPKQNRTVLSEIYAILIVLEQYVFLIFNGVYIYMLRGDIQAMSDASYLFFTQLALCSRATAFLLTRESFQKVLDMMDDEIFNAEDGVQEKIIKKYAIQSKTLYKILIVGYLVTMMEWNLVALLSDERRYPYNEIWLPVDKEKTPHYQIAYIYETLAISLSATSFLSVDTVTVATILFSCAQLELLQEKIKKITPLPCPGINKQRDQQNELKNNNKLLLDCIKHHQSIIRFIHLLQDTFHLPVFLQLCATVLILCIIGLRLVQDSPSNATFYGILGYFVLILLQIYLYCWCGTELTDRSRDFRKCLYEMPWYDQDFKFNQNLRIVLQCTKEPMVFKTGKYITLARSTFVTILRCSYSYFAVIEQANE